MHQGAVTGDKKRLCSRTIPLIIKECLHVKRSELLRVEQYLRAKFANNAISLKDQNEESCEVLIGDEFIGVLFRDEEDGELSYAFHMAILEMDLDEADGKAV
jgi:hypothetical protein